MAPSTARANLLIADERIPLEKLITHRVPLGDVQRCLDAIGKGEKLDGVEIVKIMMDPGLPAGGFEIERSVETHPESVLAGFTHCIPALRRPWHRESSLFMRSNDASLCANCSFHPGNPVPYPSWTKQ